MIPEGPLAFRFLGCNSHGAPVTATTLYVQALPPDKFDGELTPEDLHAHSQGRLFLFVLESDAPGFSRSFGGEALQKGKWFSNRWFSNGEERSLILALPQGNTATNQSRATLMRGVRIIISEIEGGQGHQARVVTADVGKVFFE